MLYCDLQINGSPVWYGVPCKNGVGLKSSAYIPFSGNLVFVDTIGNSDPTFDLLGSRYQLVFFSSLSAPTSPQFMQNLPVQPIASQKLQAVLDLQNCSITVYEKPAP